MKITNKTIFGILLTLAGVVALITSGCSEQEEKKETVKKEKPLKVLIVTGGCCHDYEFQSAAMIAGIPKHAKVEINLVNEGKGTDAQIPLYDDPNWAKPYDVVIHNECFANTNDEAYIRKITEAHKAGTPAVVVHCAMHTYRSAEIDDWREFLGVTSKHHEHQSKYPVKVVKADHPVMKDFPVDWITPMDELYIITKVWPKTTVLATSKSEKSREENPVIWVNDFHGTRVFGTTYGHTNETFSDPVFIKLLADAVVWAAAEDVKK
ncbi:MAG: ThuA domain-containing protein [Verrucomicrobiota bacterium]